MVDYKHFIDRFYEKSDQQQICDVERFILNLNSLLKDDSVDKLFDKTFVCKTFFLQSTSSICRAHYQKIKGYLINLGIFLGITIPIPSREEVIASQELFCYFRSLDEALNFIDSIGERTLNTYNPYTDLVIIKSIVVLGWNGLSSKEIVSLPKTNVSPCTNDFCVVSVGNKKIELSGSAASAIFNLRYLEEYNGLPSGKKRILSGDSLFLFRPTSPTRERIDESYIIQALKRFNKLTNERSIIFRNLRKNALFVKIKEDRTNKKPIEKIMDIMKCSFNIALNYLPQYLQWEKYL